MTVPNRDEVRDFLITRRAKVRPDQIELPTGGNRRVPGLRRAEVAMLAGVSVEYYARLERGNLNGVSESVLDAIARALQLDDAERDHLFDLARTASTSPARRQRHSTRGTTVRPGLQYTLDAITGGPALIRNGRLDIIAANTLGRALHVAAYANPRRPVTWPGTASSTVTAPSSSTPTGTTPPMPSSRSCAPRPAVTPTTRICRT